MIKKSLLVLFLFSIILIKPSFAQDSPAEQSPLGGAQLQAPHQEFFKALVVEIIDQEQKEIAGYKSYYQTLRVQMEDGTKKGKFTIIQNGTQAQITKDQLAKKGQEIIVAKTTYSNSKTLYSIYDFYRLNILILSIILFFVVVIIIAGLKGAGSILGMLVSLGTIIGFIIPSILKGKDPLTITLIGSVFILVISIYLAHGISKKTTIALFSTLTSLFLTAAFAIIAMNLNNITGLGNEDAFSLQLGSTSFINIKGLFLSGIIIGTLGALNDITTTQSSTIFELKIANPKYKFLDLFEKGFNVGKEHIASLVNTLILAYAGSSFAIFIFLVLNPAKIPYWVIFNNEIIADEIVKVIAGSIGLLLCVPIVTLIAAYVFSKKD